MHGGISILIPVCYCQVTSIAMVSGLISSMHLLALSLDAYIQRFAHRNEEHQEPYY